MNLGLEELGFLKCGVLVQQLSKILSSGRELVDLVDKMGRGDKVQLGLDVLA